MISRGFSWISALIRDVSKAKCFADNILRATVEACVRIDHQKSISVVYFACSCIDFSVVGHEQGKLSGAIRETIIAHEKSSDVP